MKKKKHRFEGIIANMERRYHETDSQMVREELAKYLSSTSPAMSVMAHGLMSPHAMSLLKTCRYINLPVCLSAKSLAFFQQLALPGQRGEISVKIIKEIQERLEFLVNVGLDYLTLDRSADTLSGGEAQRIRLASQIGAGLVGVMYVLDEPSIGLHQRDNQRLLNTLFHLRDLGNTVIVVEHDEDAIRSAAAYC